MNGLEERTNTASLFSTKKTEIQWTLLDLLPNSWGEGKREQYIDIYIMQCSITAI